MEKKNILFGLACLVGLASTSTNLFSVKIKQELAKKKIATQQPARAVEMPRKVVSGATQRGREADRIERERRAQQEAARIERERRAQQEAARRLERERRAQQEAAQQKIRSFYDRYNRFSLIQGYNRFMQISLEDLAQAMRAENRLQFTPSQRQEFDRLLVLVNTKLVSLERAHQEAARLERERIAREEAARLEFECIAREEAARKAREEAARIERERRAREEAARLERERREREEAARIAREEAAQQAVRSFYDRYQRYAEFRGFDHLIRGSWERLARELRQVNRSQFTLSQRGELDRLIVLVDTKLASLERARQEVAAHLERERRERQEAARIERERREREEAARLERKERGEREGEAAVDTCPICLEELEEDMINTECLHKFHRGCLRTWVREKAWDPVLMTYVSRCPICRTSISDEYVRRHFGEDADAADERFPGWIIAVR